MTKISGVSQGTFGAPADVTARLSGAEAAIGSRVRLPFIG